MMISNPADAEPPFCEKPSIGTAAENTIANIANARPKNPVANAREVAKSLVRDTAHPSSTSD
jgi:hypothetical protein